MICCYLAFHGFVVKCAVGGLAEKIREAEESDAEEEVEEVAGVGVEVGGWGVGEIRKR